MNSIAQAILRKAFSISCGQSDHVQAILCRTFAPGHVLKEEDLVALCQSYGCDKMKLIEEIQCRGQYEISRKSIKRKQYRYPHVLQKGELLSISIHTVVQFRYTLQLQEHHWKESPAQPIVKYRWISVSM